MPSSTSWCPHCKRAKAWLDDKKVAYAEIDVEKSAAAARDHRKVSPRGTIPVLDADGEVVVGFSEGAFQAAIDRAGRK